MHPRPGPTPLLLIAFISVWSTTAHAEVPPDLARQLQREITSSGAARCPEAASYSLERPDAAAGPTVLGLGLFVQDLVSLSDADQTLDMDVYVVARWRDPRLADASRGTASADCPVPAGRPVPMDAPSAARP